MEQDGNTPDWPRAVGLLAGAALDRLVADPTSGHPVALFGRLAGTVERGLHAPSRGRGALFTALTLTPVLASGAAAERALRRRPWARAVATAAATWVALGGATLGHEATRMAESLEGGDLARARELLPRLCGRDPEGLDEEALSRATVESIAENTSDAVVAPLVWGALAGLPGLMTYRAINTLDAMVGHRDARYADFGWAAARLDDLANWSPARLTAALTAALAPLAAGSRRGARRCRRRDGHRHPSPNAGQCEAAFAGALGVRLGGTNVYGTRVERRPELGDGRHPTTADIRRAVRLARAVNTVSAAVAAAVALPRARA